MPAYSLLDRYRRGEGGGVAIEYALMAGILTAALVGILGTGGATRALYDVLLAIVDAFSGAEGGSGGGG